MLLSYSSSYSSSVAFQLCPITEMAGYCSRFRIALRRCIDQQQAASGLNLGTLFFGDDALNFLGQLVQVERFLNKSITAAL